MALNREQFLNVLLSYESDLRAFIGSVVLDRHMRQDIFQDVAMTLWQKFEEYDSSRPFGAWARAIAAHKILQHRHQNKRFPIAFTSDAIPAILAAYDRTEVQTVEQHVALDECVRCLPEHARLLLQLRYERDLKADEIASMTGKSVDAVYQTLCRIRTRLADCMKRRLAQECRTSLGATNG
ncbi:sigma-70 family RNA polymerase sigma factor [Schlesneria paludicola]|uniref:sigma-70 family RNA polymerase sigma factor n=1 Tax=Schlesneria paludicola TaxID=360056 RepID=UPI00029AEDEA|nr:sigma-70 family RNA polymerase sigma factor [Schlesneria paludicola]